MSAADRVTSFRITAIPLPEDAEYERALSNTSATEGSSNHELAVTEGFEPSVAFTTLAFEASSFGRSDTSPRISLRDQMPPAQTHGSAGDPARQSHHSATGGEEVLQPTLGLSSHNPTGDFDAVQQARIAQQIEQ